MLEEVRGNNNNINNDNNNKYEMFVMGSSVTYTVNCYHRIAAIFCTLEGWRVSVV
jgi:hypothetical protein